MKKVNIFHKQYNGYSIYNYRGKLYFIQVSIVLIFLASIEIIMEHGEEDDCSIVDSRNQIDVFIVLLNMVAQVHV